MPRVWLAAISHTLMIGLGGVGDRAASREQASRFDEKITHVTPGNDDELRALRVRAYGRHSDIHLDPDSLERLRELEGTQVAAEPAVAVDVIEVVEVATEPADREADAEEEAPLRPPALIVWLRTLIVWLKGLRRSTVLIVVGVAVVAAVIATALALVQRVQTDPLQLGAFQVARLSTDDSFELPAFFDIAATDQDNGVQAYQQFHGLRAVTSSAAFAFATKPGSTCLSIYPEANVIVTEDSFSGPLFGGCEAGDFPPIVQFSVDLDDLPAELKSAFPESTGLQFVYDREHDEVVVFSDRR